MAVRVGNPSSFESEGDMEIIRALGTRQGSHGNTQEPSFEKESKWGGRLGEDGGIRPRKKVPTNRTPA